MMSKDNKIHTEVIPKEDQSMFCCYKYKPLAYTDFIISNQCCQVTKKSPVHIYGRKTGKHPITAQTAEESKLRMQKWIQNGCNGFDMKNPVSNPMSFWTEQDILRYIFEHKLPIAKPYGEVVIQCAEDGQLTFFELANELDSCKFCTTGCDRTGCVFCGFGSHLNKDTRFVDLKKTHPKLYEYCMNGGEYDEKGIWIPNKNGLGMRHVIEELNKIYGKDFILY